MKKNCDGHWCPWLRRSIVGSAGDIASSELSNLIHKFHQGPARDFFAKYDTNHLEAPVAHAIVMGVLDKQKISSELLEHLAPWIKFYEETEADRNTQANDIQEEDKDFGN